VGKLKITRPKKCRLTIEEAEELLDISYYNDKGGFQALCPAHPDEKASLSVDPDHDDYALFYCHAGCGFDEIMTALGELQRDAVPKSKQNGEARPKNKSRPKRDIVLYPRDYLDDRWVKQYIYHDEGGALLYRVIRTKDKKGFPQHRWDPGANGGYGGWLGGLDGIETVPYRLMALKDADTVHIVEGEKDVERCMSYNITATCNSGGAANWKPHLAKWFVGKNCIIVPDQDEAGTKWCKNVIASLWGKANSIGILTLPNPDKKPGWDFSDWADLMDQMCASVEQEFGHLLESDAFQKVTEAPQTKIDKYRNRVAELVEQNGNIFLLGKEVWRVKVVDRRISLSTINVGELKVPDEYRMEFYSALDEAGRRWGKGEFTIETIVDPYGTQCNYRFSDKGIIRSYVPVPVEQETDALVMEWLHMTFGANKQKIDFMLDWMAVWSHTNYLKLPTIVLTGARNAGKGTIERFVRNLYSPPERGNTALYWAVQRFEQNYSGWATAKQLVLDETDLNKKQLYEKVKHLAGGDYLHYNEKYMPSCMVRNNVAVMIISNDIFPLYLAKPELDCTPYFNQFFFHHSVLNPKKLPYGNDIDQRLAAQAGYFVRNTLRKRYEDWLNRRGKFQNRHKNRYQIECPLTPEFILQLDEAGGELDQFCLDLLDRILRDQTDDWQDGKPVYWYIPQNVTDEINTIVYGKPKFRARAVTDWMIKHNKINTNRTSVRVDGRPICAYRIRDDVVDQYYDPQ
jgi:hypothetical protein